MPLTTDHLAFCSWSTLPKGPEDLVRSASAIGLYRVKLLLDPIALESVWADCKGAFDDAGIQIVSGMFLPVGGDGPSPGVAPAVGGAMSDAQWGTQLEHGRVAAEVAREFGLADVSFCAGPIPKDNTARFGKLVDRLMQLSAVLRDIAGARLLLDPGRATTEAMVGLMQHLGTEDIAINFDPASMVLHGAGDPVDALKQWVPYVRQVHLRDATPPETPGTPGAEVAVGTGRIDWDAFFGVLNRHGYAGDLVIERGAGDDRVGDIKQAAAYVPQFFG